MWARAGLGCEAAEGAEASGSGPGMSPLLRPEDEEAGGGRSVGSRAGAGGEAGRAGGAGGRRGANGELGQVEGGLKPPPGAGGRASAREEERRGGLPPRAAPRSAARRGPAGGCPPVPGLARCCPAGLCPGRGAAGCRGGPAAPGHAQAHGEVPKLPHRSAPG